jgi:hypothetical protein
LHRTLLALGLGSSLLLASCGGSISLGWAGGGFDDQPPSVSLVSSLTTAQAGQVLRLSAAAGDDYAVARVEFYRVDASGVVLRLGSDGFAPYTWDTAVPDSPNGFVRYLARAVDDAGQVTDSAWVNVAVLR